MSRQQTGLQLNLSRTGTSCRPAVDTIVSTRVFKRVALCLATLFVIPVPAPAIEPGDLIKINEVHYAPAESPQASHEFIELYNADTDTLYLDGAVITDEGNNGDTEATFQFPGIRGGTTIPLPPGDFLLLVPDATGSPYPGIDFEFYGGGTDSDAPGVANLTKTSGISIELTLANAGDGITLSSGQTTGNFIPCEEIIDGVSWETGGSGDVTALSDSICMDVSPSLGTSNGPNSLQRCGDGFDSDSSADDFIVKPRTPGIRNKCPDAPTISNTASTPCAPAASEPVIVWTQVEDMNGDLSLVHVLYKTEAMSSFSSIPMVPVGGSIFGGGIPGAADQAIIEYYIQAQDEAGHSQVDPLDAPASTFRYRVGVTDIVDIQTNTQADSCPSSSYVGTVVNVSGTVTHHAREFSDQYFYIQQDTLPNSGMRIFVEDGSFQPDLGDRVTISGVVSEFMCQTQIEANSACAVLDSNNNPVVARQLGALTDVELEENESMLVTIPGPHPVLTSFMGDLIGNEFVFEFRIGTEPEAIWVGSDTFVPDNISYSLFPEPGMVLNYVTGIVAYRLPLNSDSTTVLALEPRRDDDVDQDTTGLPEDDTVTVVGPLRLHQNLPNPFNPVTSIDFEVSRPGFVNLGVFDARGALVRRLVAREYKGAVRERVVWDGTNLQGRPVPSGLYLYKLESAGAVARRKMVLVR